ncbi:MAG: glycosyltransferase family 1 protein [Ignavibacteriales bacterium]|jgi:glycosyltransferase involved in cell wall biosynthesis|nr:MAG: glycosyltransferase family 1 protein [Ignavibacteriales bacterium]
MNILHLTKDFIQLNGISTFIKSLIPNDRNNNHFVASNLIVAEFRRALNKNIIEQILPIKTSQLLPNILHVIKICKANKIDVIHSHHRYYDLLAYYLSKIYSIKTITTVHSKVYGKKKLSYKVHKIVAVGDSIKKHLIKYYRINENRITEINNFIDPKLIKLTKDKESIKSELHLVDKYVIGYVGRFDIEEKGIDILIDAIPKVFAESKDVIFVFIGDGKDEEYLVSKTRKVYHNVRIINAKLDIFNYMQIFNLIILPSRIDSFPLVMLEAAYLKIPLIGSNVDGISEFIEDGINGLLFTPEDHEDLSNKIILLINNTDKAKELGERLYQKVISEFTSDKIIPKYDKIYKSILSE